MTWLRGLVVAITLAGLMPALPVSAGVQDFTINSFTADYYLSRDEAKVSELRVDETIVATFPQTDQNHGLLRAIPKSYKNHSLELTVQKVTNGVGKKIDYTTSTENDNLVLKIGDPEAYVHGQQQYMISYTMRGVASMQADQDEFYWDINGDQWPQAMGVVTARVHMTPDIASEVSRDAVCYTGPQGSLLNDCMLSAGSDVIVATTTKSLAGYETLSVVIGFKPGTFADYQPSMRQILEWLRTAAIIIGPALFALIMVIIGWRRNGRDAKGKGVIVPQYLPPKDTSVLASSFVLQEGHDAKAISATIIDLAVRHYIKIYEVGGKDYELEVIKAPKDIGPDELSVLTMIFGTAKVGDRVNMASLKNKLAAESAALGKTISIRTTKAGYFLMRPERARAPYLIIGGILMIVGFFAAPLGLGLLGAGLILVIGSRAMPARTVSGVELREYLLGMRDYMKLAEAERIKVLQSPHGRLTEKVDVGNKKQLIKLYERLLPYAMLFGIEKEWAKQFANLYQEAPDWYSGHAAFNAVWFASSIGGFNSVSAQAFTAPSSSSGSGFGGGSGGGGGGGGGGGW